MNGDVVFPNLRVAQEALLADAVDIANQSGQAFVVVGGWSPLLLNTGTITHPGTRDVDLLLEGGASPGDLRDLIGRFLARGYVPSAKHPFQLIRTLQVGERRLAFNVDLMHPLERTEGDLLPELFVDHMDLDVFLSPGAAETLWAKSIGTPSSQLIFTHALFESFPFTARRPDGEVSSVTIPLLDEVGLIVSKSVSVWKAKRDRDALDIFLAVHQARDLETTRKGTSQLMAASEEAADLLRVLTRSLENDGRIFDANAVRSATGLETFSPTPSNVVAAFLISAGVPARAEKG